MKREAVRFPYFVLAFSMLLTVGVTVLFYQSAKSKDVARFNNGVVRIRSAIENRMGLYTALLRASRGFLESSDVVEREEFANFVRSLEIAEHYRGVEGIGYLVVIRPEEREALIAKMQAEGFQNFRLSPPTANGYHQVVIYFEPNSELNRAAIGFDMASEEKRLRALEQARDTGSIAVTGKVRLFQPPGAEQQEGFLVYLPIYRTAAVPDTVAGRQAAIKGFIFSRFNAHSFLDDVQHSLGTNYIAISIYDGEPTAENLLSRTTDTGQDSLATRISDHYAAASEIEMAGRRWVVEYETLPAFAAQSSVSWTPLIFLCGVIFSFLLFGMTYWEASTRAKLQLFADELTESEREKQGLFEMEKHARQLAEQANATKDEFISVVSHELRTPLNAIAGWTRILRNDDLSDDMKEMALEKIEKNLRLQTGLVEDLLAFSQILSAHRNLEKKEVDLVAVFDEVFRRCERAAADKQLRLTKNIDLNGQRMVGDADKIKIVIANLLSNAIKFTPPGGTVTAQIEERNGALELVVRDNGKGIKPDVLPHIFDRFRQGESSTTRNYGGLGLGLAISAHIVKLHHGTIRADSAGEGQGAVFTVRLPLINS